MLRKPIPRLLVVGVACAGLGAGAASIGGAVAAPGPAASAKDRAGHHGQKLRHGGQRALRRAVHAEAVVPTKGGTFATVTLDRGKVQSVSGNQLTLVEGTKKATYKTVTLTIPAGARVRDDGKKASLSDVKAGQRAVVFHGPKQTLVSAHDAKK